MAYLTDRFAKLNGTKLQLQRLHWITTKSVISAILPIETPFVEAGFGSQDNFRPLSDLISSGLWNLLRVHTVHILNLCARSVFRAFWGYVIPGNSSKVVDKPFLRILRDGRGSETRRMSRLMTLCNFEAVRITKFWLLSNVSRLYPNGCGLSSRPSLLAFDSPYPRRARVQC